MSVTKQLHEWRKDQWNATLESLDLDDQWLWKMNRWVVRIPTRTPPVVTLRGLAVSDSEKAESFAGTLEVLFQPINEPLEPAVIEVVNKAMRA